MSSSSIRWSLQSVHSFCFSKSIASYTPLESIQWFIIPVIKNTHFLASIYSASAFIFPLLIMSFFLTNLTTSFFYQNSKATIKETPQILLSPNLHVSKSAFCTSIERIFIALDLILFALRQYQRCHHSSLLGMQALSTISAHKKQRNVMICLMSHSRKQKSNPVL